MIKVYRLVVFILSLQLICLVSHSKVHSKKQYLLKYDQLMNLSKDQRTEYLKGLRNVMLVFGEDRVLFTSFWNKFLYSVSYAQGASSFRCLGAGFPIRSDEQYSSSPRDQECGRSSLPGFSDCPSGQRMCNPFVFGVSRDGSPVCMRGATTKTCYDSVVTGRTTFFPDDLFDSDEARESYNSFLGDFEEICNGDGNLRGGQRHLTNDACELARGQLRANLRRANGEGRHQLNSPLFNASTMNRTASISGYEGGLADLGDGELASGGGNEVATLGSPTQIYPNIGEYFNADEDPESYREFLDLYRRFGDNPALQNSQRALVRALAFYSRNKNGGLNDCSGGDSRASEELSNQEWIVITDYTLPSDQRRIFFLNTRTGEVSSDYSSHGVNSQRNTCPPGVVERYNLRSCAQIPTVMGEDVPGGPENSNTTRGGFFETREVYTSYDRNGNIRRTFGGQRRNGLRMVGLESSNYDALDQGVVFHGATYTTQGNLSALAGRSHGCPTATLSTFRRYRDLIDDGALFYVHTINEDQEGLPGC